MDLGNAHFALPGNYVKIPHTGLVIFLPGEKMPYATENSNSAFPTLNSRLLKLFFPLCVSDLGESKNQESPSLSLLSPALISDQLQYIYFFNCSLVNPLPTRLVLV